MTLVPFQPRTRWTLTKSYQSEFTRNVLQQLLDINVTLWISFGNRSKMLLVCKMKAVEEFVRNVDYKVYQHVLEILLPDVLRPIPSGMTQAIRNFAKILESSVASTMQGYPEPVVDVRVTTVGSLAQTLRRYTSLNHLAQAARAVLQNQNQITQMLADLNRVDFRNIEEQVSS